MTDKEKKEIVEEFFGKISKQQDIPQELQLADDYFFARILKNGCIK